MISDVLEQTEHRPWPLPDRPWTYAQRWHDLLFMHWPLPPRRLRALVPPTLPLDTYDGRAWVGVVPFLLSGLRPRLLPSLPGVSRFPELNVRTYVTVGGRPGVYFFSLDAASALAVLGARLVFRLPYYRARMDVRREGDVVAYRSRRRRGPLGAGSSAPGLRARDRTERDGRDDGRRERCARDRAAFAARYRPIGPARSAEPGSLEHFLTERYCLYTVDRHGRVLRVEIHHPRWPLQPAEADIEVETMAAAAGITLPDEPPLLHLAARQDVVGWLPETVDPTARGS